MKRSLSVEGPRCRTLSGGWERSVLISWVRRFRGVGEEREEEGMLLAREEVRDMVDGLGWVGRVPVGMSARDV